VKVLLSAYACEPDKGSEPSKGWNWALEIVRLGHEVWVLTRANNRKSIEAELAKSPPDKNLNFLFYDLPPWVRRWKGNYGIYIYYLLWQVGVYFMVKKVHRTERFDQVHHVTFGSIRQPSLLGNLKIPFIFGPVAGGERAPWRLRMGYGLRGMLSDSIRDLANLLVMIDPLVLRTFKQAERVYVTSKQTLSLVPNKYWKKSIVQLAIGLNSSELMPLPEQSTQNSLNKNGFRILYVGRLIYWKGMHLGLPAFARLLKTRTDARLTIVGSGPDERMWKALAEKLGVGEQIDWIPWVDRKDLPAIYAVHDTFLFPSLHDSGGMVILEAMAYGLPIICLDLGGPGVIVDETCGFKVDTNGLNEKVVIQALADHLVLLAEDTALRQFLSNGATQRVKKFSRVSVVNQIYKNGHCQD
jgi:glycosyltransferase involved in cell wall biosynthesis